MIKFYFFNFMYFLMQFSIFLMKIICLLIAMAYFTIAERKIMAVIQRRVGPNIEGGNFGLLQPLADGLKLMMKELIMPNNSNILLFFMAPSLVFILSILNWSIMNFQFNFQLMNMPLTFDFMNININLTQNIFTSNLEYGILFLLAISSLNVYGIILGGWASNSKYAFLGALRSTAQMISYEVFIGLTILPMMCMTNSFNLLSMINLQIQFNWFFIQFLPILMIFLISMLAETNRAPFDLPEAEAELVAGYNIEYSSMAFALYFLGEYCNMLLMSILVIILFFGGWEPIFFSSSFFMNIFFFSFKIIFIMYFFILVRATFPRYRYDQLMDLGWKNFLPFTLSFIFLTFSLIFTYKLNLNILF